MIMEFLNNLLTEQWLAVVVAVVVLGNTVAQATETKLDNKAMKYVNKVARALGLDFRGTRMPKK